MPTHQELLARQRAVLPSWQTLYYDEPIALVRGEGRTVWDAEGRAYLDFFGGILTTSLGHGIAELQRAVAEQCSRIWHSSTLYLIERELELAERIAARSNIPEARVFFTNSGSEANETALLLATAATGRTVVLALRNSYHGRSFATMGVTGNRRWRASTRSPLDVVFVDAGSAAGPFAHLEGDALVAAVERDLVQVFETEVGEDPACVIVEPVQGVGGFVVPPPGVLGAIAALVKARGGVLVADEVQTGWGRTGRDFGYQLHGLSPDALSFAKGLANGLPIGGVVARADLMNEITANSISTFGGNPVVAAAAIATLDYIDEHDLVHHAAVMGERLRNGLSALADELDCLGEIRGVGLMVGVDVGIGGTPDPSAANALLNACQQVGLLVGRGGLHGDALRIAPPMTVTAEEIDTALERFEAACRTIHDGRFEPSIPSVSTAPSAPTRQRAARRK